MTLVIECEDAIALITESFKQNQNQCARKAFFFSKKYTNLSLFVFLDFYTSPYQALFNRLELHLRFIIFTSKLQHSKRLGLISRNI